MIFNTSNHKGVVWWGVRVEVLGGLVEVSTSVLIFQYEKNQCTWGFDSVEMLFSPNIFLFFKWEREISLSDREGERDFRQEISERQIKIQES